jgi:hypothetical protein
VDIAFKSTGELNYHPIEIDPATKGGDEKLASRTMTMDDYKTIHRVSVARISSQALAILIKSVFWSIAHDGNGVVCGIRIRWTIQYESSKLITN